MNYVKRVLAIAFAFCLLSATVSAEDKPAGSKNVPEAAKPSAPAATTPTTAAPAGAPSATTPGAAAVPGSARTAEEIKMMMPNENHKRLDALVGNWKYTIKMWMPNSSEPQTSEGHSKSHWIMDGRFVQQDATGTAMGKPFHGMGIMGYDNVLSQYTGVWIDNMSTGVMNMTGQWDTTQNVLNETGTFSCPFAMRQLKSRATLTVVDANHLTFEMWAVGKDNKEQKMMEISYTRAHAAAKTTAATSGAAPAMPAPAAH